MIPTQDRIICQYGVVVKDLRKTIDNYRNLGIGPWDFHSMNDKTMEYYYVDDKKVEEPWEFLIGLTDWNNIQLELMQPVSGPLIYWDFLEKQGEGIHHIKEYVPDEKIEDVADSYRKQGVKVLAYGKFGKDKFFYLDTQKTLGAILELGNKLECPPPLEVIPL